MRELAQAAYSMYVERIGRQPAPMTADYGEPSSPPTPGWLSRADVLSI